MRRKLYPVISLILVLLFSIALGIVLEISSAYKVHETTSAAVIYWLGKSFSIIALILAGVFISRKIEFANKVILIRITLVLQLLPLALRLLMGNRTKESVILPVIVLGLAIVGYLVMFFLIDINSTELQEKEAIYQAKEIPVVDDNDYYDDNNKFLGAKGKDKDE